MVAKRIFQDEIIYKNMCVYEIAKTEGTYSERSRFLMKVSHYKAI